MSGTPLVERSVHSRPQPPARAKPHSNAWRHLTRSRLRYFAAVLTDLGHGHPDAAGAPLRCRGQPVRHCRTEVAPGPPR